MLLTSNSSLLTHHFSLFSYYFHELLASDGLLLEEDGGSGIHLVLILRDDLYGLGMRLPDNPRHLIVDSLGGLWTARHIRGTAKVAVALLLQLYHTETVAHAVGRYHGAGQLCGFLYIVGGTRRARVTHLLLRRVAAREGSDAFKELILAHQVFLPGIDLHGIAESTAGTWHKVIFWMGAVPVCMAATIA